MSTILFKNEADISENWLFYIEDQANSVEKNEEFNIENYQDSEVHNPELIEYLENDYSLTEDIALLQNTNDLKLNFKQYAYLKKNISQNINLKFRHLKNEIKKVFCQVVHSLDNLDPKTVIKAVLLALLPIFTGGIPSIILPFIIALVAALLKYGVDYVCPII